MKWAVRFDDGQTWKCEDFGSARLLAEKFVGRGAVVLRLRTDGFWVVVGGAEAPGPRAVAWWDRLGRGRPWGRVLGRWLNRQPFRRSGLR